MEDWWLLGGASMTIESATSSGSGSGGVAMVEATGRKRGGVSVAQYGKFLLNLVAQTPGLNYVRVVPTVGTLC